MGRSDIRRPSRNAVSARAFPDFYLVGAPKCGTTALYDFLGQHPQIFLPRTKELLFFASDLSYPTRLSDDEFLAHFADRQAERRAGAAHTAYLQSRRAAREIRNKQPDADIIILLRNPVDMLHSWHSELLYETIEDIEDFEAALDAEPERRRGKRIPRSARNSYVESLHYTDVAAFGEQVARYLDAFGHSHVHVILQDDLRADPGATYRATLEFLGVDASHVPQFAVLNPNKAVRSRALQKVYFATAAPGHRTIRRLIPSRVRQRLLAVNARPTPRAEMPPHVRQRLELLFRDDVARLGDLLDRDLSGWIA
jgi:sulfotransferase family protein